MRAVVAVKIGFHTKFYWYPEKDMSEVIDAIESIFGPPDEVETEE